MACVLPWRICASVSVWRCSPRSFAACATLRCARYTRSGIVFVNAETWCETTGTRNARATAKTERNTTYVAIVPSHRRMPRRSSIDTTGFSRNTRTTASAIGGNTILIGYSRYRYAM